MRELIKVWRYQGFRLSLYDCGKREGGAFGRAYLSYRLSDNGRTIFTGNDFGCSPCHAIDSMQTVYSLLSFLSLRPGDTDREYFDGYTPEQLEWRDSGRAEELSYIVAMAEERLERKRETERALQRGYF